MTQVMNSSEVRQQWSQLLNNVFRNQTRVVVEKSGIPIAAVISNEDLKRFIQLEEQREKRFKSLDRMREAFKGVPAKKLEQEVNKAVAEVRSEKRKQRK